MVELNIVFVSPEISIGIWYRCIIDRRVDIAFGRPDSETICPHLGTVLAIDVPMMTMLLNLSSRLYCQLSVHWCIWMNNHPHETCYAP
jgi:hypothetical protein